MRKEANERKGERGGVGEEREREGEGEERQWVG